jgi:hypothetical protein
MRWLLACVQAIEVRCERLPPRARSVLKPLDQQPPVLSELT